VVVTNNTFLNNSKVRRHRDALQAYYTQSAHITDYMEARLDVEAHHSILEPCAGQGHLIEAILKRLPTAHVDAYDIDPATTLGLQEKYRACPNVRINNGDVLQVAILDETGMPALYDRIIANPPYGAWQDFPRRRWLKARFPGLYVRDTYALFLYFCVSLLKQGGRLVFIIPDTYLNLHLHRFLRRHILTQTAVEEIVVFPSNFFPGVSYGYANMSIITLTKRPVKREGEHKVRLVRGLKGPEDLPLLALGITDVARWDVDEIDQWSVFLNPSHAFFLPEKSGVYQRITTAKLTIAHMADVVTGFYSGDDRRWLRVSNGNRRGRGKYQMIEEGYIAEGTPLGYERLNGITSSRCFVPIVKGGSTPFIKPAEWYVDWSTSAVREYKKPGRSKARFQNSRYYFREGVGVPMVSSKRVTAALLESHLFDQSIVGIFPHNRDLLLYLLGFFNSGVCTRLLRTINPSANNSANYIKKLPFVEPSEDVFHEVVKLVGSIVTYVRRTGVLPTEQLCSLNELFESLYQT